MPNPLTQWNPQVTIGATFTVSLGLLDANGDPVDGFATAEWRIRMAVPGGDTFYASVAGDWTAINGYTRLLTIPAATTTDFPAGNFQYTLDALLVDGTTVRDIIPRGYGIAQEVVQP